MANNDVNILLRIFHQSKNLITPLKGNIEYMLSSLHMESENSDVGHKAWKNYSYSIW